MEIFDLNILPVHDQALPELAAGPGLFLASKPRNCDRHRQADRLLIHLTLDDPAGLSLEKQKQLLERLSQIYFKTPGTITGALKAVVLTLNNFLLERNMRGEANRLTGILSQLVLRDDRLVLAQSGLTHAFLVRAAGVEHIYEPVLSGPDLGNAKAAQVRFYQTTLLPGDGILLSPGSSSPWTSAGLRSCFGQKPDFIFNRLLGKAGTEANPIYLQFVAGNGRSTVLQPTPGLTSEPGSKEMAPQAVSPVGAELTPEPPSAPEEIESLAPIELPAPISATQAVSPFAPETLETVVPAQATREEPAPVPARPAKPDGNVPAAAAAPTAGVRTTRPPLSTGMERSRKPTSSFRERLLSFGDSLLDWFPTRSLFQIPTSVMALFAVAVPVVVVTIATVVYFRVGRAGQFEYYSQQADGAAQAALSHKAPAAQRSAWQAVVQNLTLAETYGSSEHNQTLLTQAQLALDQIDEVQRLDFVPALQGDLPDEFNVSRMLATDNELYLLDSISGAVVRAQAANRGYTLDTSYQCGPGPNSKVIDFIVQKKVNQVNGDVLAMDAGGSLLNCSDGQAAKVINLKPPPTGMGTLKGFALDSGDFFTLDPQKNAVWIYWKSKYDEEPQLYFSKDIPPLKDVIDFTVYEDDLYLLHLDGHLTHCTFSEIYTAPTRCTDPQPYSDSRPGQENQAFIPAAPFNQVIATQPPEPALFFFEPTTPAVYQFSLRLLAYHRQFQQTAYSPLGSQPIPGPATAFALTPDNRVMLLAFGNKVVYANIP